MNDEAANIEDLLEILAGLRSRNLINIESTDATIMLSIARQTFRGTALTDRQFALMQEKLLVYRKQFMEYNYDFDKCLNKLRQPLRQIDRSKYIKIVSTAEAYNDEVYESYKSDWGWIKIRFPFSKSLIMKLNNIKSVRDYRHQKGSHIHYFKFTEKNVKNIMEHFPITQFELDNVIVDYYNKVKEIEKNRDRYIPSIKGNKVINITTSAQKMIKDEIGDVNDTTILKLIDRRHRYGITNIEYDNPKGSLDEQIALRKDPAIHLKPNEYKLNDVLYSLNVLERYPLLVLLDEDKSEEQLYEVYNFYKNFLPAEEQSVIFRLEGSNKEFNQMVKDYKLNNWVDNSTKIVYSSIHKLPKLLFKSNWLPIASVSFNSKISRNLDLYIKTHCDLVIFYDEAMSPLRRYSQYYG